MVRGRGKINFYTNSRVASTKEEMAAALSLVYSAYLAAGLEKENSYKMRVTPYHLLPTTDVFFAEMGKEFVLTMTLVRDGALGLPMESVYRDEVNALRSQGQKLAEVTCLADQCSKFGGVSFFLPAYLDLSRLLAQYAKKHGVETLVAVLHPRHVRFYRSVLGFKQFGEKKSYPGVNNNPAIPMMANFEEVRRDCPECYDRIFGEPVSPTLLNSQPISAEHRKYFAPMVDAGGAGVK